MERRTLYLLFFGVRISSPKDESILMEHLLLAILHYHFFINSWSRHLRKTFRSCTRVVHIFHLHRRSKNRSLLIRFHSSPSDHWLVRMKKHLCFTSSSIESSFSLEKEKDKNWPVSAAREIRDPSNMIVPRSAPPRLGSSRFQVFHQEVYDNIFSNRFGR